MVTFDGLQLSCTAASVRLPSPGGCGVGSVATTLGAPLAISLPLRQGAPRAIGGLLPDGRAWLEGAPRPAAPAAPPRSSGPPSRSRTATRVRPPADMVRLEDRLACLLQPPLETLLSADTLPLPFDPFTYQMEGIAFLCPRRHAVLADEMGLGKTMQAITAIRVLAHRGQARRVLLVCPKPLVTNWRRELAMWAPELTVAVVEGAPARREWRWRHGREAVTLVGYETLVRDAPVAHEREYDLVLLDESQRIKNPGSATAGAVRGLRRARSWALTGTPIENSLDDLVGIFEFVSPGLLRPGMSARAVGSAVSDAVIRRTKDEVLNDLPPKLVRDEPIELTPEQWETYTRAEDEGVLRLRQLDADEHHELTIHHVFELVLRLKQVCNFDPVTGASAKLERLAADLDECVASGRKAIVFSQWVDTIQRIAEGLAAASGGAYQCEQYHGRVPHGRRDAVLQRFRDDPNCPVLLMSYGAGSVGLNLQFAGYVFLFDRWWNPAVEDQAINRAHRIGAAGPVTVTRMLATGTIEERIDQVLRQKRELFDSVFRDGIGAGSAGLSRDDLLGLFPLRPPSDAAAA
ncbi:DEAD/DEAH box helicase [Botrimarina sp.]|uniref:DEAD/DEAH box helicase n=1 Tax=Botrimarina sp. TaxID=2795802 RepID=UPI0032ED7A97